MSRSDERPLIGITVDVAEKAYRCRFPYADMVRAAGGTPLLLPCVIESIPEFLACCDGFVTTGGDDPDMSQFGIENHPKTTLIAARRQAFELALLEGLDTTNHPLLAICLGMQLMCLHAGGTLQQHLPDTLETAGLHWDGGHHPVNGHIGSGDVHSHHRQAISDPGRLQVVGVAPDGVIEAVADPDQPGRVGVQWHPERTECQALGSGLFQHLVLQAAGVPSR